MPNTAATDIKVGDEVRVLSNNSYHPHPEGGYRATVIKVGRKYAAATFTTTRKWLGREESYEQTVEFDMATGVERDGGFSIGHRVRTLAQLEQDGRRAAAVDTLTAHRVKLETDYRHPFTLEQIEALAEVVKTWDAESADA